MRDAGVKRLWLVRLGKNGEYEADALEKSVLSIDFNMKANLSAAKDREAVLGVVKAAFPDAKPGRQADFAA